MIVWRMRGKTIRTVLYCVLYAHTYEQLLKMSVGLGLGLFLCKNAKYVYWFNLGYFVFCRLFFAFVVLV